MIAQYQESALFGNSRPGQTVVVTKMQFQGAMAVPIGKGKPLPAERTPGKEMLACQCAIIAKAQEKLLGLKDRTVRRSAMGKIGIGARCLHSIRSCNKSPSFGIGNIGREHKIVLFFLSPSARSTVLTLLVAGALSMPAFAQVPTNDAARVVKETQTRTCMERARSYKQRAEAPTKGIRGSFASPGSTGASQLAGGATLGGGAFGGTSVGGIDLSAIMQIVGSTSTMRARNAGEVLNAIAATTAAIPANQGMISQQGAMIGSASSIQGAFDQNSGMRLSGASLWGQTVEGGNTMLKLRNQRLLDEADAQSKAARIWGVGGGGNAVQIDPATISDNASVVPTAPSTTGQVAADLKKVQAEAKAKPADNTPKTPITKGVMP